MKPAEKRLLEACKKGELLNLGDNRPFQKTNDNEIRGEFLVQLILNNNQNILKIHSQGINFQGAYVSGIFNFSFYETNLPFRFMKSTFENQVVLIKSKVEEIDFSGSFCSSFSAMGLICRSNILLNNGFESNGEINFLLAEIKGYLNFSDSKFINENSFSLNFINAKIEGDIFFRDNFESVGEINFFNSKIGKSIYCSGKYINKNKISLNFNGSLIDGSIFLKNGFTSIGEVNFASAKIKNNLECDNGEFLNEQDNKITLNGNGADVQGSVFLRNGFLSKGEVNFINLKIGGILDCSDGKFINKNGISLNCNGIKVEGTVFLRNGFLSEGEVNFIASKLASLDCSNSEFICGLENNISLICNASIIEGNVFFNNNFKSKGEVNFIGSQIGSNFECTNGKFTNEGGFALNCFQMIVNGSVFLNDGFITLGTINFHYVQIKYLLFFMNLNKGCNLNLSSVKVNELQLTEKEEFGELFLDGLEYNHLSGKSVDSKTLLQWLEKMPEFKPQPYKQLVKVLRNMGHHKESNDIMIKYNDITTSKSENWFIKKLKQVYGITAGYGYKPLRVLVTMFLIWFFCSLFYLYASKVAIFAPSNTLVFQNIKYKSSINKCGVPLKNFNWSEIYYNSNDNKCIESKMNNLEPKQKLEKTQNWTTNENLEGEYTTFSPYWYSLDILLPIVDLQMDKDWGVFISPINSDITMNHVIRWIVWIEILFGWIYSLILVAILSGLAKNEKD